MSHTPALISMMAIFVAVVDTGSVSAAARRLGQPKSVLSRRLDQLETRLGVRLLHRTTRVVKPTSAGEEYYQRSVRILADIDEAEQVIRQDMVTPLGRLRVQLPIELGMHVFGDLLTRFAGAHPGVSLELDLSNRHIDMIENQYDVAIRIGTMPNSSLVARKILSIGYGFYASPNYLSQVGEPASPKDLQQHACLRFATDYINGDWVLRTGADKVIFRPRGPVVVNSLSVLRDATINGLGIAMLPHIYCNEAVGTGVLKRVLNDFTGEDAEVFLLYPNRQYLPSKVTELIVFLDAHHQQISDWINNPLSSLGPRLPALPVVRTTRKATKTVMNDTVYTER